MTYATYSTIGTEAQSALWTILRGETALTALVNSTNIVDGVPVGLIEGVGFPYVVVNGPAISEESINLAQTKMSVNLEFNISAYATQESILRSVVDAIRKAITNATDRNTFLGVGLVLVNIDFGEHMVLRTPHHVNKAIWTATGKARFRWSGSRV